MTYIIYCWQNKTHGSRQISSQAVWYHWVKNKLVTSHYSHIHHRFMVDEFPVNSNTGATHVYRHISQTVTVIYKINLLCNDNTYDTRVIVPAWGFDVSFCRIAFECAYRGQCDIVFWLSGGMTPPPPPPRLLCSIFDLGYYVILISAIGNGTIEQHPLPPPPRLHHDSATIWRICFIFLIKITYEWTMCHVSLSGQYIKGKGHNVRFCIYLALCNAPPMRNHAIIWVFHFLKWFWKIIIKHFRKYMYFTFMSWMLSFG